jgi:hypothetical protein
VGKCIDNGPRLAGLRLQWREGAGQKEDASPAQKAIQAARAREAKLDELLGVPPTRPAAPLGGFNHPVGARSNVLCSTNFES